MIVNKKKLIDNRIKRASTALSNAESEWAKKYWFKVWKNLCLKYKRVIH